MQFLENVGRLLRGGPGARRRLYRKALYRGASVWFSAVGIKTPYGIFLADSKDRGVGEELFAQSGFEDFDTLRAVTDCCIEHFGWTRESLAERTFLEIGANIGTCTVPALARVGFGRAICLEPEPSNFRLLNANLALNGLSGRATTVNSAVGAAPGTAELWVGEANHGDHRLWRSDAYDARQRFTKSVVVPVVTLDSLAAGLTPSPLVWIDTQGFEGFVLDGAHHTRGSGTPFLLEFWPDGMRRAGSWSLFQTAFLTAKSVIDIRKPGEPQPPSEALLARLEGELTPDAPYSDLLLTW